STVDTYVVRGGRGELLRGRALRHRRESVLARRGLRDTGRTGTTPPAAHGTRGFASVRSLRRGKAAISRCDRTTLPATADGCVVAARRRGTTRPPGGPLVGAGGHAPPLHRTD